MAGLQDVHYDAFISYRHSEFDSFVVENLHKKLENFKLPKSVIPKVKNGKTKITRIFRDVDELPLADNLSDPISAALANSDFLICVCTPRYPQSRWCMKEIEVFLQTHPRDHLLVLLAEDEPVNSFPEILNYVEEKSVDENGNEVVTRREIEPLAADTRGTTRKEVLKAMDTAVIKLCAAIFGLNFDDLRQRHREQKMRRMAAIFGGIGAAVLGFAIFATCMLVKISRQYDELEDRFANTMAQTSVQLTEAGRRMDAVYAVRDVLPYTDNGKYNGNALSALYSSLGVYKVSNSYYPEVAYDIDAWVSDFDRSPNGEYVLVNDDYSVCIYECETGYYVNEIIRNEDNFDSEVFNARFCGDKGLIVEDGEDVFYYEIGSDKGRKVDFPATFFINTAPDGSLTTCVYENAVYAIDGDANPVFTTDLSDYAGDYSLDANYVSFADDKIVMCLSDFEYEESGILVILDAATGEITLELDVPVYEADLIDGILYLAYSGIDDDTLVMYTAVIALDPNTGDEIWTSVIENFSFGESSLDIVYIDDQLCLGSTYDLAILSLEDGSVLKVNTLPKPVITVWGEEERFVAILTNGAAFEFQYDYSAEITESFYDTAPSGEVAYARYYPDGNLFVFFAQASYISRYAAECNPEVEMLPDYDYSDAFEGYESAEDELFDDEEYGADLWLLDIAMYSEDKEYIVALFTDHTVKVYDTDSKICLLTFETPKETYFSKMFYSEITGSYIITGELYSRILDKDFKIVSVTDRILAEEDGCFIINSIEDYQCYKVPYVGYEEVIDLADEYLGEYEPWDSVKEKYGLR